MGIWGFRSFLWRGSSFLFRSLHLGVALILLGILFLLILRDFISGVSWRRDEGAGRSELGDLVGAVAVLGSFGRIGVSGSIRVHAVEGVQVQIIVPGACNTKCCVSSVTGRRALPLAEPFAGVP
jgi:hypothetical protein